MKSLFRIDKMLLAAIGLLAATLFGSIAANAAAPTFSVSFPLNDYWALDDGSGSQTNPKLASSGTGQYVAAWDTNNSKDILVSTSLNGGTSWFTPVKLFSGDAKLLSVHYTTSGWVVLWTETTPYSDQTPPGTIIYSAQSSDGASWEDPVQVYSGSLFLPDAASDGDNILVSVGDKILKTTNGGVSWASIDPLSGPGTYSQKPSAQIASAGNGKWYLAVEGQYGVETPGGWSNRYGVNLHTSTDNGDTWSTPVDVTGGTGQIGEFAARGDTLVSSSYPSIRTSLDGGQTWTGPWGTESGTRSIAVDDNGNWIIVAEYYENPPQNGIPPDPLDRKVVLVTSTNPAAGWTVPVPLDSVAPMTRSPFVIADGTNGFMIIYERYGLDPGVPSPDSDIYLAHRSALGGNGLAPTPVNQVNQPELPFINDIDVSIVRGGGNTVMAMWRANADAASGAEHIMVARSTNNGGSWSFPTSVSGPYVYHRRDLLEPELVYAGTGRWLIAYYESGQEYKKYVISDDNGSMWHGPYDLEANHIAANGNGTVVKYARNYDMSVHSVSRLPRNSTTWEPAFSLPDPGFQLGLYTGVFANTNGDNWCLIPVNNNILYTSTDDGRTWTLTGGSNLPGKGRHDIDDNGNIVALDYKSRGSLFMGYDLFARRSSNNGVDWSTPKWIGIGGNGILPLMDFDMGDVAHIGNNSWIIGWDSAEYAISNNGGQSWTSRAPLPFKNPFRIQRLNKPAISGRNGRFIMAWHQPSEEGYNSDLDIYYAIGHLGSATAAADWQLYR